MEVGAFPLVRIKQSSIFPEPHQKSVRVSRDLEEPTATLFLKIEQQRLGERGNALLWVTQQLVRG